MKLDRKFSLAVLVCFLMACSSTTRQEESQIATPNATVLSYTKSHGVGDMAMSPDGEFIAFFISGMDARQFVLFSAQSGESLVIEAPVEFEDVGDMSWSPDGDELVFLASPKGVLSGSEQTVWRLQTETLEFTRLVDLAFARRPTISKDGTKLALFEGVTGTDSEYVSHAAIAYALFEIDLSSKNRERRSVGHFSTVWNLQYDDNDDLFASVYQPVVPDRISMGDRGRMPFVWSRRDETGFSQQDWERQTGRVSSFKVASGELLDQWPTPFPEGGAPYGARAVRPMPDGRLILMGSIDPENTKLKNWLRYYGSDRDKEPKLMRTDYIAYSEDGTGEVLPSLWLNENEATSGGADISSDGLLFARVIDTHDRDSKKYVGIRPHNRDTLHVLRNGEPIFKIRVSEVLASSEVLSMPNGVSAEVDLSEIGPHRISVP